MDTTTEQYREGPIQMNFRATLANARARVVGQIRQLQDQEEIMVYGPALDVSDELNTIPSRYQGLVDALYHAGEAAAKRMRFIGPCDLVENEDDEDIHETILDRFAAGQSESLGIICRHTLRLDGDAQGCVVLVIYRVQDIRIVRQSTTSRKSMDAVKHVLNVDTAREVNTFLGPFSVGGGGKRKRGGGGAHTRRRRRT